MLFKQLLDVFEVLDSPKVDGEAVKKYLQTISLDCDITVIELLGKKGKTDVININIPGKFGKSVGKSQPTIGLIGRLGGLGARPDRIGFVSDGDGALTVLGIAAKLLTMRNKGEYLDGDVMISTNICPNAPTSPHFPVPFMGSPVEQWQVNQAEVSEEMDAILCVDTTKGNRIINYCGYAISPTVKDGYILRVSDDLLTIMEQSSGKLPKVFAISTQDITPYGNGIHHINSIMQPSVVSSAPVVGVAITSQTLVPGCSTGASRLMDIEEAARFMLEVAISFGRGECQFYNREEFASLETKYGSMKHIKTFGRK